MFKDSYDEDQLLNIEINEYFKKTKEILFDGCVQTFPNYFFFDENELHQKIITENPNLPYKTNSTHDDDDKDRNFYRSETCVKNSCDWLIKEGYIEKGQSINDVRYGIILTQKGVLSNADLAKRLDMLFVG